MNKKNNEEIILANLDSLYCYLNTGLINNSMNIFNKKLILRKYENNSYNIIRIWRTGVYFNKWYEELAKYNFIAAMDYKINNDNIKLDYINVNNNENENERIKGELIEYIIKIAKMNNKNKIIIDVHSNLKFFNNDYENYGFVATKRASEDNPYWVEAELMI